MTRRTFLAAASSALVQAAERAPIRVGWPIKLMLLACIAGMLFIGIYPSPLVRLATGAVSVLR